jgi:hypothetical protein
MDTFVTLIRRSGPVIRAVILVIGCVFIWRLTVNLSWLFASKTTPYLAMVGGWLMPICLTFAAAIFLAGMLFGNQT